jgi:hypothetical protein
MLYVQNIICQGTLVLIHNIKAHEEVDILLHAVLTLAPYAGSYCLFSDSHHCPSNSAITIIVCCDEPLFPIIPSAGEIRRVCAIRTDYVTAKQL